MRPLLVVGLATALLFLAQMQLACSSRVDNRFEEQAAILSEIRAMPNVAADADGYLSYERNYARTNHHTGAHTSLYYKVRRHKDLYIDLDKFSSEIIKVSCGESKLTISVKADHALVATALASWAHADGQGKLMYRTVACAEQEGETPLFRRIVGKPSFSRGLKGSSKRSHNLIVLAVEEASPFAFFGKAQVRLFTNESLPTKSHKDAAPPKSNKRFGEGQFNNDGEDWGYGGEVEGFGFNYDAATGVAAKPIVFLEGAITGTCTDCYASVTAGMGFEFETDTYEYNPDKLLYMRLYTTVSAKMNVDVELKVAAAADTTDGGATMLLQELDKKNIDYRDPGFKAEEVDEVLKKDIEFYIGAVRININFKLPIFLKYDVATEGEGSITWGNYATVSDNYELIYINPNPGTDVCTMQTCVDYVGGNNALCIPDGDGWCSMQTQVHERGGFGPKINFPEGIVANVYLVPILVVQLWGGGISAYFEVEINAIVTGRRGTGRRSLALPSSPTALSIADTREHDQNPESACASTELMVSVDAIVTVAAWAVASQSFMSKNVFEVRSPVFTLFTSERFHVLSATCLKLGDIINGLIAVVTQRPGGGPDNANAVVVPLPDIATVTIPPNAGVRAQLKAETVPNFETVMTKEEDSTRISEVVKFTPHGQNFASEVDIMFMLGNGTKRGNVSGFVPTCDTFTVSRKGNDDADWEDFAAEVNCSMFDETGVISFKSSRFSYYAVHGIRCGGLGHPPCGLGAEAIIAGAVVGTLIFLLLVGFVIYWFCFRGSKPVAPEGPPAIVPQPANEPAAPPA